MDILITDFTANSFINAFGLTLLHSIWIGGIAALLSAVTLALLSSKTAAIRYQVITAMLPLLAHAGRDP